MEKHPNIINVSESPANEFGKGRFAAKAKRLSAPTGGKGLGCNWYEVPPGKTAFPYHYHTGIEESLFILRGKGTLRLGGKKLEVKEGDYISFPAGPEAAHCLTNTGPEALQYLAISNQNIADIVGYPDSKKFALHASPTPEQGPWVNPWLNVTVADQPITDYFAGEDTGE